MRNTTTLFVALAAGLGAGASGSSAQELLDFRFKAAHNAFERPYQENMGYDDLVGLYGSLFDPTTLGRMAGALANGRLFNMIVSGDQRIPFGQQAGWLNTWSLELDVCWNRDGFSRVRHFPGMDSLVLVNALNEYWNADQTLYGTRDRLTIFWLEWKTDSDCDERDNDVVGSTDDDAAYNVMNEIRLVIADHVVFGKRELMIYNGLDPDGPLDTTVIEWPSPQWLHREGYRVMFASQAGSGVDFFITPALIANSSDTSPNGPPNDGRLARIYPNRSAAAPNFSPTSVGVFLANLGNFNPWGGTRFAWDRGMDQGFNIVATNDIRAAYSTYWGLDDPAGFRTAPPMPMYVGGQQFFGVTVVDGTIGRPYGRLRFAEQHLRLSETISGSGITDAWPVLFQGGVYGIDHINQTNRFEPRVPLRLQAKPGQTVRLVPGPG